MEHPLKTLRKSLAPQAHILPTLVLALAALGLPMNAVGQDLDLSGEWIFTVESPNGTGTRQVTLIQDGNELTGEISSERAAGDLSGTVDGDQVTFVAVVFMDSGAFEITYTATVTDGVMSGTVDFGSYGSGTFTGRRVESSSGAR